MNIRVLIYMNPLTVDKIAKKFLYEKDSGFLYTRQLIESLPSDWRFTILVPKGFDRKFFDSKHEIDCVEYDYSTSIHQNRYHFNRNIIAKALPYATDIDVVLNMQPEVAANLKVFFENQRREKPIIVNYFHWIDCKESRKYGKDLGGFIWRQVEGANAADLNLFHTEQARELFYQSIREEGLDEAIDSKQTDYFHPLPTTFGMEQNIGLPRKYILFNHRLNNSTGWREVLEIFKSLDTDAYLWFTDESNLKVKAELEGIPRVIVKSVPFESYGYVLANAHFTVCNLQDYATWNMAVLDSMNHGTIVLSKPSPLMSQLGAIQCDNLADGIRNTLTWDKIKPEPRILNDFNLEKYLIDTITDRVYAKTPKKFDDVFDYIKEKDTVEKREWVNKFWSFHANSNFQLIRWRLLQTIKDDITKKDTTYNW